MQQPNHGLRRFIAIVIVLVVVGGLITGGWWVYRSFFDKVTLTLEPQPETRILVQKTNRNDSPTIADTASRTSLEVQKGEYVITFSGDSYQQKVTYISVNEDTTINTPELQRSPDFLEKELSRVAPIVQASFMNQPRFTGYTVARQSLYEQGDWYGATLVPADPTTQDILRIVLRKNNTGSWQIVAGPEIVLSVVKYPDVPATIIRQTSNQPLN